MLLFCSVRLTSTSSAVCIFWSSDCEMLSRGEGACRAALHTKCVSMFLPDLWAVTLSTVGSDEVLVAVCCAEALLYVFTEQRDKNKAPERMYGGIVAGTSSSDFTALSSSLLERESLVREGYGDGREECGDTVIMAPKPSLVCCLMTVNSRVWLIASAFIIYTLLQEEFKVTVHYPGKPVEVARQLYIIWVRAVLHHTLY